MLIDTREKYEEISDGTRLKVVLLGDDWGEDTGASIDCLKFGDKLYDTSKTFFLFSERNDKTAIEDLSFLIVKTPGKDYEI